MKITLDAQRLQMACKASLAERTSGIPMLKHALLRADSPDEGSLTFTTTDTQKVRAEKIPCTVTEAGEVTCEPSILGAALSGITGDVSLELNKGKTHLLLQMPGKRTYRLETLPAADFPLWPAENAEPIKIDPAQFLAAVGRATYAIDAGEARRYLRGLCIGKAWALASDGKRGAQCPCDTDLPQIGINIPKESLSALVDACAGPYDALEFSLLMTDTGRASGFRIQGPNLAVTTRLIDEAFPIDALLRGTPKINDMPAHMTLQADDLMQALDRLRPFCARGADKFSMLDYAFEEGHLKLISTNGDGTDRVPVAMDGKSSPQGRLNPEYVRQVLTLAKGKSITWHWKDALEPSVFTLGDSTDLHVVQAMRI